MVDTPKKTINPDLTELDKNKLIHRIDELEKLLARKKESKQKIDNPRFKIGEDGIPILIETVSDDDIDTQLSDTLQHIQQDNKIVDEIISKVEKEISQDLDDLIVMLKDSIIDDVKSRILSELNEKNKLDKKT